MTNNTQIKLTVGYPLPEGAEFARHLIDIAADMVISVNKNRQIRLFNKKAEEVYGYTADEILDCPITQLYHDQEEYRAVGEQLHKAGQFVGEIVGRKKNGETFPVLVTAVLLHTPDGKLIGSVGYSRDLTAEKKAAAVEREYVAMLGEEKLRKEVEHITRHDMKSPLGSIIGYADLLLEDETLSNAHKELIKIIYSSGVKALRMVNLSMDLLKIERGTYSVTPQDLPLIPILGDVQNDNATLLRTKQLSVVSLINRHPCPTHALPEQKGACMVRGEEIICYNIFANLYKNAVEAAPPQSQITFTVMDTPLEQPYVTVTIHNLGAVPVDVRGRFFEKYVTAGKKSGTGLGTYSAKRLTETLGGTIRMTTDDVTGTTVTVMLPKAPIHAQERSHTPASLSPQA